MPTNSAKKALAKAKKGIFSTGACSTKADPNFAALKDNKELPCPHCDRIFKQQDRLKQHIQKQHADVVAEQATTVGGGDGDGGGGQKISAKAALIQQQAAKAKEDKAREAVEKGEKAPMQRMSCKLPSTILREFVQTRRKDLKAPLFKSHEVDGGWTCKLVLRDKQGKTEKDRVFWWKENCATKQEAEHRVSVVALAAVAQNLPLQRLLPGEYKNTFADAEEAEKRRLEHQKARAAREEERIARAKARGKAEAAQVLTMSEDKRVLVESILRETWVSDSDEDDDDVDLGEDNTDDEDEVNALCDKLTRLGFHRDDALAASRATKSSDIANIDPAISWLCVHVPESRLPATYAPQSVNDGGVVLLNKNKKSAGDLTVPSAGASSSRDEDARPEDGDAAWLWERGYSRAACEAAAKEHAGNREGALASLFGSLLADSAEISGWPAGCGSDADAEDWLEELTAIEAIVGEDKVRTLCDGAGVAVDVETESGIRATLEVYRFEGCGYPSAEPPAVAFHARGAMRDSFRAATSKLAELAAENVGTPCIYTLLEAAGGMIVGGESERAPVGGTKTDPQTKAIPAPRGTTAKPAAASAPERKAPHRSSSDKPTRRERPSMSPAEIVSENKRLSDALTAYMDAFRTGKKGDAFSMMTQRSNLPASNSREEVTRAVAGASVVVLSGETGCGKSTQVPQFILEHEISKGAGGATNIIVTQPRRISAIGLAERVAAERLEKCGDVVGYSVRLESKLDRRTRLLFCTTGVLLRRLLSDPTLKHTTHVVLDEVHERSVDSDLLLLLLRKVLAKNPKLKVVLMSATADADLFDRYFKYPGAASRVAGVPTTQVHIPGFTHPVREYFLEDVFEMTGHAVGRGGPYAKRKEDQAKRVKRVDVAAQAALAEKAKQRRRERVALGLEDADEDDEEDEEGEEDGGDDVPEDWDLADENSTYEVKPPTTKLPPELPELGPVASFGPSEEDRVRNDALAEASRLLAVDYSAQTQRSIQNVDQTVINYDAIEQLIAHIIRVECEEGPAAFVPPPVAGKAPKDLGLGAVLVFMPGQFEITKLIRKLEQSRLLDPADVGELRILPLYGSLSSKDQRKIFERPPKGVRKIVVATNIAETSVTIDDVRYVVDTGRAKEMCWDSHRGLSVLADTWVSQAAAKQRRGRSGRTAPGARFAMFSRAQFANASPQQPPEMLRTPLQKLCLSIKAMAPDEPVASTLAAALTPPDVVSVDSALAELKDLRAFDIDERLTPLGRHLAQMPVDARIGKMLLFGALLGCLDPILTIAGAMSGRPLFYSPKDNRDAADKAKRALNSNKSDHLTMVAAYNGWSKAKSSGKAAERRYCDEYFLSQQALEAVQAGRADYAAILADLGFVRREYIANMRRGGSGGTEADCNADVVRVVKAALVAGFYPHVVRVKYPETKYTQTQGGAVEKLHNSKDLRYFSKDLGRVFLHPTSVNFHCGKYESRWIVYSERVETAKVYIRDNTMVGSYALLLFGGDVRVLHDEGLVKVDGWATFQAPARIGVLVKELRQRVDQLLLDRINHPSAHLASTPIVRALLELLASEGH